MKHWSFGKAAVPGEARVPVPLYPTQIPRELVRARTLAVLL